MEVTVGVSTEVTAEGLTWRITWDGCPDRGDGADEAAGLVGGAAAEDELLTGKSHWRRPIRTLIKIKTMDRTFDH
jgi:hypothetical protein